MWQFILQYYLWILRYIKEAKKKEMTMVKRERHKVVHRTMWTLKVARSLTNILFSSYLATTRVSWVSLDGKIHTQWETCDWVTWVGKFLERTGYHSMFSVEKFWTEEPYELWSRVIKSQTQLSNILLATIILTGVLRLWPFKSYLNIVRKENANSSPERE